MENCALLRSSLAYDQRKPLRGERDRSIRLGSIVEHEILVYLEKMVASNFKVLMQLYLYWVARSKLLAVRNNYRRKPKLK